MCRELSFVHIYYYRKHSFYYVCFLVCFIVDQGLPWSLQQVFEEHIALCLRDFFKSILILSHSSASGWSKTHQARCFTILGVPVLFEILLKASFVEFARSRSGQLEQWAKREVASRFCSFIVTVEVRGRKWRKWRHQLPAAPFPPTE